MWLGKWLIINVHPNSHKSLGIKLKWNRNQKTRECIVDMSTKCRHHLGAIFGVLEASWSSLYIDQPKNVKQWLIDFGLSIVYVAKFMWLMKIRSKENTIMVVAWPVRGAGNNPEALVLASHIPSPTSINATTNLVIGWHAVQILVGQGRLEVMLL